MTLEELVRRYLEVAGQYGRAVPLAALGVPREELERWLGVFDEDYHISRYLRFTRDRGEEFIINGLPQTHLSIEPGIEEVL